MNHEHHLSVWDAPKAIERVEHYESRLSQPVYGAIHSPTCFSYLPLSDSLLRIDDIDNCRSLSATSIYKGEHLQAGFKLAPPTRKPSISPSFANSLQFFSLTLPP